LIFSIQKGDRITKSDMAWSHDTAEGQHVKGFPFLSCELHISSHLPKWHVVTSHFVSQANLPKSDPQDAIEVRIQASRMAALTATNE
jgi:hypothetical protein